MGFMSGHMAMAMLSYGLLMYGIGIITGLAL